METAAEKIGKANRLARAIYSLQGFRVPDDFKFYETGNPRAAKVWETVVFAFDHIEGTPLSDCLEEMREEQAEQEQAEQAESVGVREERLIAVVKQIISTWRPPRVGTGDLPTASQTSALIGIAYAKGLDWMPFELMDANQTDAIRSSYREFDKLARSRVIESRK